MVQQKKKKKEKEKEKNIESEEKQWWQNLKNDEKENRNMKEMISLDLIKRKKKFQSIYFSDFYLEPFPFF